MHTIAILPYIPCSAKLPVFLTLLSPLFKNPFQVITILYFLAIGISLTAGAIIGDGDEGMICEIAPISRPRLFAVKNKLCFYLKGFIIKVTMCVATFCAVSWVLSHFTFSLQYVELDGSILCVLSKLILPIFYPMGIKDWRIAYASFTGFVAKENVAGTLQMFFGGGLNLTVAQSLSLSIFFLTCPACISAFASSVKEIGLKKTAKYNLLQLILAFLFAYLTYFLVGLV
jgi:ferrous iron transport protein B